MPRAVPTSEFELDAVLLRVANSLVLNDRPVRLERVVPGDLGVPLGLGATGPGVRRVDAIDVLDQPTTRRAQPVREEEGAQIGTAAPQQHGVPQLVTSDEARHHHDLFRVESSVQGGGVQVVRMRVQDGAGGGQVQGLWREHAGGDARSVEQHAEQRRGVPLASGQQGRQARRVHVLFRRVRACDPCVRGPR